MYTQPQNSRSRHRSVQQRQQHPFRAHSVVVPQFSHPHPQLCRQTPLFNPYLFHPRAPAFNPGFQQHYGPVRGAHIQQTYPYYSQQHAAAGLLPGAVSTLHRPGAAAADGHRVGPAPLSQPLPLPRTASPAAVANVVQSQPLPLPQSVQPVAAVVDLRSTTDPLPAVAGPLSPGTRRRARQAEDNGLRRNYHQNQLGGTRCFFYSDDPDLESKVTIELPNKHQGKVKGLTAVHNVDGGHCWYGFFEHRQKITKTFLRDKVFHDDTVHFIEKINGKRVTSADLRAKVHDDTNPWEHRRGYFIKGELHRLSYQLAQDREVSLESDFEDILDLDTPLTEDEFIRKFHRNIAKQARNPHTKCWELRQKLLDIRAKEKRWALDRRQFAANHQPWMSQFKELMETHEGTADRFLEETDWGSFTEAENRVKQRALRGINWFWSNVGSLMKNFCMDGAAASLEDPEKVQVFSSVNVDGIKLELETGKTWILFNLARAARPSKEFYTLLEDIKDGRVFSPKYNSRTKAFRCLRPGVAVFANFPCPGQWHPSEDEARAANGEKVPFSRDRLWQFYLTQNGVEDQSHLYHNPLAI